MPPRIHSFHARATPSLLFYAPNGLPTHLTADNAKHAGITTLHVPLPHFVKLQENAKELPKESFVAFLPSEDRIHPYKLSASATHSSHAFTTVNSHPNTSHAYTDAANSNKKNPTPASFLTFMSLRDPIIPSYGPGNDRTFTISTYHGNSKVSLDMYLERLGLLSPNVATLMADECIATATNTRHRKSIQRTSQWATSFMAKWVNRTSGTTGVNNNQSNPISSTEHVAKKAKLESFEGHIVSSQSLSTSLFATLVGGPHVDVRLIALQSLLPIVMEHDSVIGVNFSGLQSGEDLATSCQIVSSVVEKLPSNYLRLASGSNLDLNWILHAIHHGIDLFEFSLGYQWAVSGYGASFPLSPSSIPESIASQPHPIAINLVDPEHAFSTIPIVENCQCLTCRSHTRAYIHHLLVSHELTAFVLLELHNSYHCNQWMDKIREIINLGPQKWSEYFEEMSSFFSSIIPVKIASDRIATTFQHSLKEQL